MTSYRLKAKPVEVNYSDSTQEFESLSGPIEVSGKLYVVNAGETIRILTPEDFSKDYEVAPESGSDSSVGSVSSADAGSSDVNVDSAEETNSEDHVSDEKDNPDHSSSVLTENTVGATNLETEKAQNTATTPTAGEPDDNNGSTDPAHDQNVELTKGQLGAPVTQVTDDDTFAKMAEDATNPSSD